MTTAPHIALDRLRYPFPDSLPRLPLAISKWLFLLGLLLVPGLLIIPWQQTVAGSGRVVAYSPTERQQDIEAPVSGRIVRWHVVEGSRVKAGDPILDMADIDPHYMRRLEERLMADQDRIEAAKERSALYDAQTTAYEKVRVKKVEALQLKVRMAEQKLKAAEQKVEVARATVDTARVNLQRLQELQQKGLVSERQMELAQLELTKAQADLNLSEASVSEEEANVLAAQADTIRAEAEGRAQVATAKAEMQKAESERAYARGDVTKLQVEMSRQLSQVIVAPVDGTVVAIDGNLGGGVVKEGQHLARLVPDTQSRAVELYVDANDAPLIREGSLVRVQFEGWPALQFVGWPSVAVGTFGGLVSFVDPAALDAQGRVRILVKPDPKDQSWPQADLLRQQVRARAWVLLQEVPLGWELWRKINGFPPALLPRDSQINKEST